MQGSYIGNTTASQAVKAGSIPVPCSRKETPFVYWQKVFLFNEINPLRDLWNNASRYEIADAMKYAAAYEGFILFHILPLRQNIS